MKNKNILVITPFFAPETHAAVFRAHKLVKYLKREGWNPIVLTVDINYVYNEDLRLLEELKDVPIYRARYIEPTLRGIKMWLTGKDRTYKTLKKNVNSNSQNVLNINALDKVSFQSKIYTYILEHWANSPDRFWTWERSATRMAKQLIKEYNIDIIYTTSPPFTSGKIGINLKKDLNIKWVADFRDPISTVQRNYSNIESVYIKQRRIKHRMFHLADAITTASFAHNLILHDIFKGKDYDKIHFIPTGLDEMYLVEIENTKKAPPYFLYSGEYLKENGSYFFELVSKVINDSGIKKTCFHIKIVGNKEINSKIIDPFIFKYELQNYIEYVDHLPQQQLYNLIQGAKAVLLLSEGRWWCSFAKMVDYIALQKPVIALVPEISEARTQLTNAGLGLFLEKNENDIEKLKKLILSDENDLVINIPFCKKYLASSQVKSFITVFENL